MGRKAKVKRARKAVQEPMRERRRIAGAVQRSSMRLYLEHKFKEDDPDELIMRPETDLQWHTLVEHNLTRWRNGQEPGFDEWNRKREEILAKLAKRLTPKGIEMLRTGNFK
jgi:hypothetical protein